MSQPQELSLFRTPLGWFALAGREGRVSWCSFGHASRDAALRHARKSVGTGLAIRDWQPTARRRLCDFVAGRAVVFDDIPLDLDGVPAFHRAVLGACFKIPYGRTLTYAGLAAAAGRPGAVRAAGSAMARNPLPIIIPCHRVVRTDGGLGGYSCPQGPSLKRRLLDIEAKRSNASEENAPPRATRRWIARTSGHRRKARTA